VERFQNDKWELAWADNDAIQKFGQSETGKALVWVVLKVDL